MPNCRRPYCATEFPTTAARDKHEKDATRHTKPEQKADPTYLCDDPGHADAIAEAGFCPVCQ